MGRGARAFSVKSAAQTPSVASHQTIPDALRGRLAGVELLSYGIGPSAGQIRAGAVAGVTSARFSLASGGLLCAGAVGLVCLALPAFTGYRAQLGPPASEEG